MTTKLAQRLAGTAYLILVAAFILFVALAALGATEQVLGPELRTEDAHYDELTYIEVKVEPGKLYQFVPGWAEGWLNNKKESYYLPCVFRSHGSVVRITGVKGAPATFSLRQLQKVH